MRLLTFMQLAEGNPEMSFQMIQDELQLKADEVEPFIIDGMFCYVIKKFYWPLNESFLSMHEYS